jgi:RNA polymerase sigma-70 factor (ECF subfamily)
MPVCAIGGAEWYPPRSMDESGRQALEHGVRDACQRGDHATGVTLAIKGYGPELFGFLVAVHRNEADASDAFGELTEALWHGLPKFEWQSSFRTWAYATARGIMRTNRRNAGRREKRGRRVGDSEIAELAQKIRTETLGFLQTERRTRLQALRDGLPEEDRILLVLRVDRKLSWSELATVLAEETEGAHVLDADGVTRESARLRKRFQVVKDRLRLLAKQEGLIE